MTSEMYLGQTQTNTIHQLALKSASHWEEFCKEESFFWCLKKEP